ncbi:MAG: hypothetical protein ACQEP1_04145 [Nanobdellota archaeon]
MKKRGQISFFIVAGVLIILVAGLFFFLEGDSEKDVKEPEEGSPDEVPSNVGPVQNYVEQCLHDLTREGIDELMHHGGYIYQGNMVSSPDTTEGNSVEVYPGSGYKVPYWYHMKSKNQCSSSCDFSSLMKPLCKQENDCFLSGENSVETELARYIEDNMDSCLKSFTGLEKKGYEIEEPEESPEVSITVRNDSVLSEMDYPISMKFKGKNTEKSRFSVSMSSLLYDFYKEAYEVTKFEQENGFVSRHAKNVLSYYARMDGEFPPFNTVITGVEKPRWTKYNLEDKFEKLLMSYMPALRLANTSTVAMPKIEDMDYKFEQGVSNEFTVAPFSEERDVFVSFLYYDWWDIFFDVSPPEQGQIIGPSQTIDTGSKIEQLYANLIPSEYMAFYDFSFPTMVELRKINDKGRQKVFRFALEGNIRGNRFFKSDSDITGDVSSSGSLLCDFPGEEVYDFEVLNDYSGESVEDVKVHFYAGEECSLSTTNGSGKLKTRLPMASGGTLRFRKNGYLDQYISVEDLGSNKKVRLKPLVHKNVSLKIFNHSTYEKMSTTGDPLGTRDAGLRSPNENETVIVQAERVKDNKWQGESSVPALYNKGKEIYDMFELTEGDYRVTITYITYEGVNISEEKNRICIEEQGDLTRCKKYPKEDDDGDPLCEVPPQCSGKSGAIDRVDDAELDRECFKESDCYKVGYYCEDCKGSGKNASMTNTYMPSAPLGGAIVNKTSGYWHVDYENLMDADNVTFFAYRADPPERHHELKNMKNFAEYSMQTPYAFRPELE